MSHSSCNSHDEAMSCWDVERDSEDHDCITITLSDQRCLVSHHLFMPLDMDIDIPHRHVEIDIQ